MALQFRRDVARRLGEYPAVTRSIILERRKAEGLAIIHQITDRADIVCANLMDDQLGRLGVDAASLTQRNPRGIGVQNHRHPRRAARAAAR